MADAAKPVIRLTWEEWQASRDARRKALAERGLGAPCRRSTAKPETLAAARLIDATKPNAASFDIPSTH